VVRQKDEKKSLRRIRISGLKKMNKSSWWWMRKITDDIGKLAGLDG